MNKLREQIITLLCKRCICDGECSNEMCLRNQGITADAIIALLQPRMLTKDEAEHLLELIPYSPACDDCLKATAKLKLIQEEDSE